MKKGFTLVEMAMVLIVVGLLMGGGFQMMKVMQEKARSTEAKNTLNAAKEAIIAFAINSGRLPIDLTEANVNIRAAGDTNITYYVPTNIVAAAFLTTNLCQSNDTTFRTQVTNPDDTLGSITPNIAFVLAVNGENMQPQTIFAGNPNPLIFPRWNATIATIPYDDFHTQVTLAELQSLAGCQPLRIIPTSLPQADDNSTYNIDINATGGGGSNTYSWCWTIAPTNNFSAICAGNLNPSTDNCVANGWRACPGLNISKPINTGTAGTMSNITIYTRDGTGNTDNHSYSIPMN
jgi:prepilin-type N-terminal cleavage/methylation domain-containing protein